MVFLSRQMKGLLLTGHVTICSPSATLNVVSYDVNDGFRRALFELQPNLECNLNNYGVIQQIYSDYY